MRKFVVFILCLLLVLSGNCVSAFAIPDEVNGVVTYPENDERYNDNIIRAEYGIGSTLEKLVVSDRILSICDSAFSMNTSLYKIELGKNLQSIGKDAFIKTAYYEDESNWVDGVLYIDDCLIKANPQVIGEEYVIQPGTRLIADGAFEGCEKLEKVTMPLSIEFVGQDAFIETPLYENEKNWENGLLYVDTVLVAADKDKVVGDINIKDGTVCIANSAFVSCTKMDSIVCPESLLYIGEYAFTGCEALAKISLGRNVNAIGYDAFFMCNELENITVDKGNKFFTVEDGVLYNKNKTRVIRCPQKKSGTVTLPDSVVEIGEYAFSCCSELEQVSIPESCLFIGDGAFAYCYKLKKAPLTPWIGYIGWWAFTCCYELEEISVPGSVYTLCPYAFQYCTGLTSVHLGESVKELGTCLFDGCENLNSLELGSQVFSIHNEALRGTKLISNVENYKDGMLILSDQYLISVTADMKECRIPEGVTFVAKNAFSPAIAEKNLEKIFIPESMDIIYSSYSNGSDEKIKVYYDGSYDEFQNICHWSEERMELYTHDYYRILWVIGVTGVLLIGAIVAMNIYNKKAKSLFEKIFEKAERSPEYKEEEE